MKATINHVKAKPALAALCLQATKARATSDVEDMMLDNGDKLQMQQQQQHGNIDSALLSRADLVDAEYPNRPRNTGPALQFRDLVCSLFEAMVDLQHKPQTTRRGPQFSAHEARRNIITRFIQRWRNQVGPDIYPAFRLVMPDRDKDRPMYGLKEASLGKMLVAVLSPIYLCCFALCGS